MVKSLIEIGAVVNVRTRYNKLPIDYVSGEVKEYLLEKMK